LHKYLQGQHFNEVQYIRLILIASLSFNSGGIFLILLSSSFRSSYPHLSTCFFLSLMMKSENGIPKMQQVA